MCAAALVLYGFGEDGVRLAIRATARTTLAVFVVVFCASAIRRRWPGPATHWLMRNRRYLGLSAAVSHGYHLVFIGVLYGMGAGGDTPLTTVIGGAWGFVLLFALAATSNDASQRRLRGRWRQLHLLGVWTVWIIFAVSYLPAALESAIAAGASVALLAALLLRVLPQPRRAAST